MFDALTHRRPYKEPWSIDATLDEIARPKGRQFDSELTDLFLALVPRLVREVGDLDAFLGQAARESRFIQARRKIADTLKHFNGANSSAAQLTPSILGQGFVRQQHVMLVPADLEIVRRSRSTRSRLSGALDVFNPADGAYMRC